MVDSSVPDYSIWDKISYGFLSLAWSSGYASLFRLIQASKFVEDEESAIMKTFSKPCYRLQRMVVDPTYQGQGIGSYCLEQALRRADVSSRAVILETQELRNVRFYERL